jgi:DNA-binding SARP family transcriptional activator/streptogramin lyase
VEFLILGPLEVVHDGRRLRIGAAREKAILAVLLLSAGRVVSRERLIDELWGESPPPTAAKAVNVYISHLRRALAVNGADPIATRAGGYAIEIDPAALDAARFEELVAEAQSRLAAGDVETAATILRDALGLWRGSPLGGVALESVARSEGDRLEELRLGALLDRIDCDLALGRHANVVSELEVLVAQHPLRERLRAQYMLGLYRSGRQADALRAYQDARNALVDELGLEPSPALQRLERGILNHDPALQAPTGIAAPAARTQSGGRRVRVRPLALGATLAVITAAITLAIALGAAKRRSGTEARLAAPDSIVAVSGGRRVTAVASVGALPSAVVAQRGFVWVLSRGDATVSKLDARTGAVVRTVSARGTPVGLALGEGSVWVIGMANTRGTVLRIDPETGKVANTRLLGAMIPRAVTAGEGGIWLAAELPGRPGVLLRLSPRTTTVAARLPLPIKPTALALGQRELWVLGRPASGAPSGAARVALYGIDPATGGIVAHAVLRADPDRARLAISPRSVWISDGRGAILKLDPITAQVTAKVSGKGNTVAMAADTRSLWTVNQSAVLRQLNLTDGRAISQMRLAPHGTVRSTDLAVEGSLVWISVARGAPASPGSNRARVRIGHMRAVSIPVAGTPTRSRYGADAVWVKPLSAQLIRIDPRTNRVVATIAIGTGWGDIAFGFGSVWATSFDTNTVSRIDPRTNRVIARIATHGLAPMGIAATRDAIWVANHHADPAGRRNQTGSVVRIDPHTNRVVAKIPLGAHNEVGGPDNMTATAGGVWLDIPNQALIVRIDARTNQVSAKIPVEIGCGHLAGGAGAVWVAEGCSNSIVRIDPASNRIVRRIVTTANTYPLVFAHGSVWATTNDLRLIRIDPSSNSIVDSFDIDPAARPTGGPWFTVAAGSVWLSDSNSDHVLRLNLPR